MKPHINKSSGLLAGKIKTLDDVQDIAESLVPIERQDYSHFAFLHVARIILREMIMSLHAISPGRWRLKELEDAVRKPECRRFLLMLTPRGRELYTMYFEESGPVRTHILCILDMVFRSSERE
jgi:hypothetical protein